MATLTDQVMDLLAEIEGTALRDLNVELAAYAAALGAGTPAEAGRARCALLEALEVYGRAREQHWLLRKEVEDGDG
jgi:hypothetical protein